MQQKINDTELFFGLVCLDRCLFAEHFFHDDLSEGLSLPQKIMFCDQSQRKLLCCGRKVAKTVYLESEIIRTGITQSGEGMFFAPAQSHIAPVRNRVTARTSHVALFSIMHTTFNKAEGIDSWRNGAWTWHWRIEGQSGSDTNMVGLRGHKIMGDELAFGNMVCHNSRELVALPDCEWIYAGVPNNWRHGVLYAVDQTSIGKNWSKHKLRTFDNPLFNPKDRRQELKRNYGGEHTSEYVTQVLGEWGEEMVRSFPPGAISQLPTLPVFEHVFGQHYIGQAIRSPSRNASLKAILNLPRVDSERFVIGVDYGFSPDPCVILVAYEGKQDHWYEMAHIELKGVIPQHQAAVIHTINQMLNYKVVAICIEFVGGGLTVAQELRRSDIQDAYANQFAYDKVLIDANPGGQIEVPLSEETGDVLLRAKAEALGVPFFGQKNTEEPMVRMGRKVWMNELLRNNMIRANNTEFNGVKIWWGQDNSLIESIMNVAEERTPGGHIVFRKLENNIQDHAVDAARTLCCGIEFASEHHIEVERVDPSVFGWFNKNTDSEWEAPWR